MQIDSGPLTIRLHGIDSPERNQALGKVATKALRARVEGEPLEIQPIEQNDNYGRMIAKVLVRGDDVNARMVESGYAWAYRRYLRRPDDEHYCLLEAQARAAGRGVWSGSPDDWEPPWEFRRHEGGSAQSHVTYAQETPQMCLAAIGRRPAAQGKRGAAR